MSTTDRTALALQARLQRTTLDEPEGASLVAVLAGLALAIGVLVAISFAGDHLGTCWRVLVAVTHATATVLEGG